MRELIEVLEDCIVVGMYKKEMIDTILSRPEIKQMQEAIKTLALIANDLKAGDYSTILKWKEGAEAWDKHKKDYWELRAKAIDRDLLMSRMETVERCETCTKEHINPITVPLGICPDCWNGQHNTGEIIRDATPEEVLEALTEYFHHPMLKFGKELSNGAILRMRKEGE